MSVFQCFVAAVAGLASAYLINHYVLRGRSGIWSARFVLVVVVLSLFTSFASQLVRVTGNSGTGTRVLAGWPRSFASRWSSWQGGEVVADFNILFFAANSMVHFAGLMLAAACFALRKPGA